MATGFPTLTKVTIAGVDMSTACMGWKTDATTDNTTIQVISIKLAKRTADVFFPSGTYNEQTVVVQRGILASTEQYVFRGYVTLQDEKNGVYNLTCSDKMYALTKITVTKTFDINTSAELGVYSEIMKTLVNSYSSLTADSTSVQSTGTVNTISRFVCKQAILFERMKTIADTIGWQLYYNPNTDKVVFEPYGYPSQATTLTVGDNIVGLPIWNTRTDTLFTKVEVRGAYTRTGTTELGQIGVTTGYTTLQVQLTKTPISAKVYCDAGTPASTLKVGGTTTSSTPFDYSIDVDNKLIKWNTGTFTPGGAFYVKVDYDYPIPTPVIAQDNVAHALYDPSPTVWKQQIITRNDIQNVTDAEAFAKQWINLHKNLVYTVESLNAANVSDLAVGQTVSVVDPINGYTGSYYVTSMTKQFPYRADSLQIVSQIINDDLLQFNIDQRIKRLEEQNSSSSDITLHSLAFDATSKFGARYAYIDKLTYSSSTATKSIVGLPGYDVVPWFVGLNETPTTVSKKVLIQGNNTYAEYVYDTDFYDSVNSTSTTWNTTTKAITVLAGGTGFTSVIAKGVMYSAATVTIASSTGSYVVSISGDGKSTWQVVTNGVRLPFVSSSTAGVYLKIVAASDSVLSTTFDSSTGGKFNNPAIQIVLEE